MGEERIPKKRRFDGGSRPVSRSPLMTDDLLSSKPRGTMGHKVETGPLTVTEIDLVDRYESDFYYVYVKNDSVQQFVVKIKVPLPLSEKFPEEGLVLGNRIMSSSCYVKSHKAGQVTISLYNADPFKLVPVEEKSSSSVSQD